MVNKGSACVYKSGLSAKVDEFDEGGCCGVLPAYETTRLVQIILPFSAPRNPGPSLVLCTVEELRKSQATSPA